MRRLPIHEPPLSPRQCADFMGLTAEWVRVAITRGVRVQEKTVFLDAERLLVNGRRLYRVHPESFAAFLKAIGWQHLPRQPRVALDAASAAP
jgi:hypothetical protein